MINDGESPAQSAPAPTKQRRIDNLLRIADDDSVNNFARSICGEAARFLSTQSAPAQEPVAWRVKDFADGWILVHTWPEAMAEAESAGNTIQPLYAAPPPDEARELLETAKHELIWCSERRHEARVNALVERIRAYLEKHK